MGLSSASIAGIVVGILFTVGIILLIGGWFTKGAGSSSKAPGTTKASRTVSISNFRDIDDTTIVMGFWYIPSNQKHDWKHYTKYMPKTFDYLKNAQIIFYYDDLQVLDFVKENIKTDNVIYIRKPIKDLYTYEIAKQYLIACQNFDYQRIKKINSTKEKALTHYDREYKLSNVYHEIFTIWTSKLLLIKEAIVNNPFKTTKFAWIDTGLSKFPKTMSTACAGDYTENYLYHFSGIMKFYGEHINAAAGFLLANKSVWNKLILLYQNQLLKSQYDNYVHDEETILHLVWKNNPNMFHLLLDG